MLIKTSFFKECCNKILNAIDNSELSTLNETLELKTHFKTLYLNVTNKEYYASVKFNLEHEEKFHATVNAHLFLKLISQLTTEFIELTCHDTYVNVKGNGNYKIPLIFENENLIELTPIVIENPTVEMDVDGNILQSILQYNSKELAKGSFARPVQKMFYVDQQGCITFTSGACVNDFTLEKPIRILLDTKLVKLFKLLKNERVKFVLGYDPLADSIIQTKVKFETENIVLTAILSCDNTLLNSVPVDLIRNSANYAYPYSIVLSKGLLSQALNRLLIFSNKNVKTYGQFDFKNGFMTLTSLNSENVEELNYESGSGIVGQDYSMILDLDNFKTILDGCAEQYVTLNFGESRSCVLVRNNIKNVIPLVMHKEKL